MQFGIILHELVFQKYQNLTSPLELFDKLTSANKFQIKREKSYNYLLITYMKKFNGRLVTGTIKRFMSPSLNVWKFFGKLRKRHWIVLKTNLPAFFELF